MVDESRMRHLNLGRVLRLSAMKFGQRTVLDYEGTQFSYRDFNAQVNALAHRLQDVGVAKGDRVMLLSENSPAYLRSLFALAKVGAVSLPTNSMLTPGDISRVIDVARPRFAFVGRTYAATMTEAVAGATAGKGLQMAELSGDDRVTRIDSTFSLSIDWTFQPTSEPVMAEPVSDADVALILFSSGSTGTPKGVVKSHSSVVWSAINRQIAEPRRPGDREGFCLPLAGIAFANFVLTDVLTGATCVMVPRFDPRRVGRMLADEKVTHIFLAPTMMAAIERENQGQSYDGVRVVETSFEFPLEQRQKALDLFPQARILWSYGSTEASMARTPPEVFTADVSCVGYASGLDEYRVTPDRAVDLGGATNDQVGDIEANGPTLFQGYLSASDEGIDTGEVLDDGWFRMGDLGWMDENGALHFSGRSRDIIKSGGANVFARDVELALLDHPSVTDVAVVGLQDPYWGESVVAVVEIGDDHSIDKGALDGHLAQRLAAYAKPKAYFLVAALPKNPTGKIAKGVIRQLITDGVLEELS